MEETEAIAREHGLRSQLFEIYYAEIGPQVGARDAAGAALRSPSCAPYSIRRGGWTSRISGSRNRRCAASKAATPKPRTPRPKQ